MLPLLQIDYKKRMRPRWFWIGWIGTSHTNTLPQLNDLHKSLNIGDFLLRKTHDVDITFSILSSLINYFIRFYRKLGLVIQ